MQIHDSSRIRNIFKLQKPRGWGYCICSNIYTLFCMTYLQSINHMFSPKCWKRKKISRWPHRQNDRILLAIFHSIKKKLGLKLVYTFQSSLCKDVCMEIHICVNIYLEQLPAWEIPYLKKVGRYWALIHSINIIV